MLRWIIAILTINSVLTGAGVTEHKCGGYQQCANITITGTSDTNVECSGEESCKSVVIRNITNVYCIGTKSCASSTMYSINHAIYANGNNSLSNAIIIDGSNVSNYNPGNLYIFANGTNNDKWHLYCNTTVKCYVNCQSSYACTNLHLHCNANYNNAVNSTSSSDSNCHVSCDNDIKCPQNGSYNGWNADTLPPGNSPTHGWYYHHSDTVVGSNELDLGYYISDIDVINYDDLPPARSDAGHSGLYGGDLIYFNITSNVSNQREQKIACLTLFSVMRLTNCTNKCYVALTTAHGFYDHNASINTTVYSGVTRKPLGNLLTYKYDMYQDWAIFSLDNQTLAKQHAYLINGYGNISHYRWFNIPSNDHDDVLKYNYIFFWRQGGITQQFEEYNAFLDTAVYGLMEKDMDQKQIYHWRNSFLAKIVNTGNSSIDSNVNISKPGDSGSPCLNNSHKLLYGMHVASFFNKGVILGDYSIKTSFGFVVPMKSLIQNITMVEWPMDEITLTAAPTIMPTYVYAQPTESPVAQSVLSSYVSTIYQSIKGYYYCMFSFCIQLCADHVLIF